MKYIILSISLLFSSTVTFAQHTEVFVKFHKDYFEHLKSGDARWIENHYADTSDMIYLFQELTKNNEFEVESKRILPWCTRRNLKQAYYEARESYLGAIKEMSKQKMAIEFVKLVPYFKNEMFPNMEVYHIYFNTPFDSLKIIPSCVTFLNKQGQVRIYGKAFHIDPVKKRKPLRSIESIRDNRKKDIEAPKPKINDEHKIYLMVEQMPQFGRGDDDLVKYLNTHINYPALAKKNNIQGTVYLNFIVNVDGSLEQIKINRDIGGGCGAEAVRVVKAMPKWKAGKQNGEAKRVEFTLPVQFSLKK